MKRLIAALILLGLIIGICCIGNRTVTDIHAKTYKILDECEKAILSQNKVKALSAARSAVSYWKKRRLLLCAFVNHSRYTETEICLVKICKLISGNTLSEALPECAEAKVILKEIYSEQRFKLENIL